MRRKQLLFSMLILAFGAFSAQAQLDNSSKFYIKVNAGYGLLTPGSYKLVQNVNTPAGNQTSLSSKGMGQGIRFGGGIGVIVSDFLNIGADFEYLKGANLVSSSTYVGSNYVYFSKNTYSYNAMSITPHVIFKALSKPDYLIYNKVGILLQVPFDLKTLENDSSNSGGTPSTYNSTGQYHINLQVGLNVALGVQYRLTDKMRLFGEIFANYIVLTPKTYDYTTVSKYSTDPTETNHYHITYIDKGTTGSTSPSPGENQIVEQVQYSRFNMHTIGVNVGVSYRF